MELGTQSPAMTAAAFSDEEDTLPDFNARKQRWKAVGILSSDEDESTSPKKQQSRAISDNEDSDVPAAGMTARERIRRMLMSKDKPAEEDEAQDVAGSSEDDAVVQPRRRKLLRADESTPSPAKSTASIESGLFVSPSSVRAANPAQNSDEDELPTPTKIVKNARFEALKEKKRQERLAKEAEAAAKRRAREEEQAKLSAKQTPILDDDEISGSDDGSRRLTQQVRPTRKASKKALEEMQRETQRISRNMQLAHQAKTKKKITKDSLFAKFNYRPEGVEACSEPATSSSPRKVVSDVEAEEEDTPPTSPLAAEWPVAKPVDGDEPVLPENAQNGDEEDLPELRDIIASSPSRRAVPAAVKFSPPRKASPIATRPIKPRFSMQPIVLDDSSDDDLEIVKKTPIKARIAAVFDRIPAQQTRENNSLHTLKLLANLGSPEQAPNRGKVKLGITQGQLQMNLQQRMREQAAKEKEERLAELRAKGIIIQTAEEREKEAADVEDLIAKARRDAEAVAEKERKAAKKARKESGVVDPLDMDASSDDEDYVEEGAEAERSEGDDEDELMESEDEDEDEEMADDEEDAPNPLFENEASESETGGNEAEAMDVQQAEAPAVDDDEEDMPMAVSRRRSKKVVFDDEDEFEEHVSPSQTPRPIHMATPGSRKTTSAISPAAPTSVLRSATKTFIPGLPVTGPAGLGLTQIFQGTMDTQVDDDEAELMPSLSQFDSQQDSLAFLNDLPPSGIPGYAPTPSNHVVKSSQMDIDSVPASQPTQTQAETQGIRLDFHQSQIPQESQFTESQMSQDQGFQHYSPIAGRYSQPFRGTADTVVLNTPTPAPEATQTPSVIEESPVAKRKGKLRRRIPVPLLSDDEDEGSHTYTRAIESDDEFELNANAFSVMKKAARPPKSVSDFDKKKSAAKDMIHEQASESEDEYAGLGGASDDDSGEDEAFAKEMIDDETPDDFDESKLAALFADRDRAEDEARVSKLYKDLTTGRLRRKRNADFELSDSDDDGEARRRMKQREFARMRKALLEDERIEKIAENPKRAAFLRTLEDRDEDGENYDWLDEVADVEKALMPGSQNEESQSQSQSDVPMGPPKRKSATLRRAAPDDMLDGRHKSLAEIRRSVSSLLEDPNSLLADQESDSDSDLDIEGAPDKENTNPYALPTAAKVIDRFAAKRAASARTAASSSGSGRRMVFATRDSFKVPPLLRKATTNSSMTSTSESVSETKPLNRVASGGGGIKSAGGNAFFATSTPKQVVEEKGEKKRMEKLLKMAGERRRAVGGLFGRGKFT
jgi:mediator of replication checkpoint protein 1